MVAVREAVGITANREMHTAAADGEPAAQPVVTMGAAHQVATLDLSLTGESSWAAPVPLCIACARMRSHLPEKIFYDFRSSTVPTQYTTQYTPPCPK